MFERFTDRARRALVIAQEEARLLGHNYLGTEHMLLGLLHEGQGVAAKILIARGVDLQDVRARIEKTIGPVGTGASGAPPFTPRAKRVMEFALREALQLGHNYIGTEHLLLGLVREGEGVAAQVLRDVLGDAPEQTEQDDPKMAEALRRAEQGSVLSSLRQAVIAELSPSAMVETHPAKKPPQVTISFSADEALEVVVWLKAIDTVLGGTEGSRSPAALRKALMRALNVAEGEVG